MKKLYFILCILLPVYTLFANDERSEIQATLRSVTVYRSGAEMIHNAAASLKAGNNEVIIDNISNNIDSNSIQIKAPATVTILGFEFSSNYMVNPGKSPRIILLEDSLQHIQDILDKLDQSINNIQEQLQVLQLNRDIKGEQTGLSVTELSKLMDYYATKSTELENNIAQ